MNVSYSKRHRKNLRHAWEWLMKQVLCTQKEQIIWDKCISTEFFPKVWKTKQLSLTAQNMVQTKRKTQTAFKLNTATLFTPQTRLWRQQKNHNFLPQSCYK